MRTLVRLVAAAPLALLTLVACSEEQRRDVEGAAVRVVLEQRTEDILSDNDVELDGDLDCSADIGDDGSVTGTCTGTDADGNAVESSFEGTVDVDEASCEASLVVTRGSDTLSDESDVDCLDA